VTAIAERVAAGAAFLDEHDPPWWRADVERAIDLGMLELADPAACILGQRCPLEVLRSYANGRRLHQDDRYWAYAEKLKPEDGEDLLTWASGRGFSDRLLRNFPALTAEWKRLIEARRSA